METWEIEKDEHKEWYIDGSVQDCNDSIANALELSQLCAKLSMYFLTIPPL